MQSKKILITGSRGFIASKIVRRYLKEGKDFIGATRNPKNLSYEVKTPELSSNSDWSLVLSGVDTVIHLAGRAHIIDAQRYDEISFLNENFLATRNIAEQSAKLGVKRFIFISTIAVNGSKSSTPFTEESAENPETNYAKSKLLAERALKNICQNSKMNYTIIRSPLVSDLNSPGNLSRIRNFISKFRINPFVSIKNNLRSFISVDSLVEFIILCAEDEKASNQLFMVADCPDISTAKLSENISNSINKYILDIKIHPYLIKSIFTIMGRNDLANSITGNLQINPNKSRALMGWVPLCNIKEGIKNKKSCI